MPRVGIKVRISRQRQNEKKMPAMDIVTAAFDESDYCAEVGVRARSVKRLVGIRSLSEGP